MTITRKASPYIIGGTNVPLTSGSRKPTLVMMVDCSNAYHAQVRAMVGSDTLIEMRKTEPNDYQPLDNPEQRADEWWARNQGWINALPAGDNTVIAGYNEIAKIHAAAFARFERCRLERLHAAGRRGAMVSCGVGRMDEDEWPLFAIVRDAMRAGDVWDCHEYASDLADIDNRYHVGRFTIPAISARLGDWPIVVSEYGYDYTPDTGKGWPGWQLQPGANNETCLAMLRKGGQFYDTQSRVIGYAAYQMGSIDPKFAAFNMYNVWPNVVAEYGAAITPTIPPVTTTPAPSIPYYHSSRQGYAITDIVLHDTEGSAAAAESWFRSPNNPSQSSAHVIVTSTGKVMRLIPDEWSAHHAGYATIPGREGVNPNRFSLGLELEYPVFPATPPWPTVQLEAAAGVVRKWCDTYHIEPEHIWEHKTIDPTRRKDPRNWNRAAFLGRVWPAIVQPLPNDEQGPPALLAEKAVWWAEEMQRQFEAGKLDRAQAIRLSLIQLLIRLKQTLGG